MIVISVVLGFIVTQPSSAQEATTEQPPTLEQEAFRTKLDGYLDSVKLMAPQMPNYDPASVSQLQEAQKLLAEIDGPQLQELKEVFELYPDAWRLLEVMDGYIEYGEYQANYQGGTGSLTSHSCPPAISIVAVTIARAVDLAFEAIVGVLNDSLTITAFGFGVTVPNPIYVIAAVIWYVDRAILLTFETINDINNDCETGNDQSITHDVVGPRVDTTVSSRSTPG